MGYDINTLTDGCYEGTTCLINKFDIRDSEKLGSVESQITLAKISMLHQKPLKGNFDFEHYKAIHRFLFGDLYEWAVTVRTVNMSKKGTLFAQADEIETIACAIFERVKKNNCFKGDSFDEFVDDITDLYCATNYLHPFREGNGRTQRVFLSLLANEAGFDLNFSKADTDGLLIATIHAANGVESYLKDILQEIITKK